MSVSPALQDARAEAEAAAKRKHREVLQALTGLLLGMFVSMLASTVVSTSLPVIISDLEGDQAAFTWVVTATLLATAVSTPVWGKLADLLNRKVLVQLALIIFIVASAAAGFAQNTDWLIAMRVIQGIGAGGLGALTQIIMADIISPRERGRYMGLFGAVMALSTVGGPLIGGVITDSVNWRWNFYVAVPLAAVALFMIQKTLHLPALKKRKVTIDYAGIILLAASVSVLLIWVSLVGTDFDWISAATAWMVGGSLVGLAAFVFVELKSSEPVIPLTLFRNRTFTFSVIGSLAVGVAMFGTSVFLSQYMQLARGASATMSGIMTIPMMGGLLIVSTLVGKMITKTGRWKAYVVSGAVILTVALVLMGTIEYDTNFWLVSLYMFLLGAGVGMVMQNLVLVVQNDVPTRDLGVASSGINFFRTIGGTIGVSALGAVLATQVTDRMAEKQGELMGAIMSLGEQGKEVAASLTSGAIPAVSALPEPVRVIVESVYGSSVAHIFMIAAPLGLLTLLAVLFLPNLELGSMTRHEKMQAESKGATTAVDGEAALETAEHTAGDTTDRITADAQAAAGQNPDVPGGKREN
ncbi:MFS transporter [Arthrobacter sp. zg-Y20]|uniref:MDR family MFS transporter n=1 Tax=unclassified Arthrobacter TaxID=235627 RepID=UPI001D15CC40|nr:MULTISPECIES: MDR family MFS transporter [unclassified Arthrobacter]MCC3275431.1 MFS transporter [Arthrobacter sp. zg-Y20]MDK1315588.1 MDR family MFS transporter [Arthrobacter sp. zg.Y20]WIB06003.1 MDR family MFS transporter [Arthrobacter sp. zg-Y20]